MFEYKPLKTLSLITIISLAANGLSYVPMLIASLGMMFAPNHQIEMADGTIINTWFMLIGVGYLFVTPTYIASVVLFLVWLYRAHKNLGSMKPAHLEYSPGWAVGWWFIPFANLVKPFQVVREVWWESDPEIPDEHLFLSASLHSAPTYMGLWWAFWLGSNILSNIASRVFDPERPETTSTTGFFFSIASLATIIAAVLAIRLVSDISSRQAARFENARATFSDGPPPPPTFGEGQ